MTDGPHDCRRPGKVTQHGRGPQPRPERRSRSSMANRSRPWPRPLIILLTASAAVLERLAPRSRSTVPPRRFHVCSGNRKYEHRYTRIRRDAHRWHACAAIGSGRTNVGVASICVIRSYPRASTFPLPCLLAAHQCRGRNAKLRTAPKSRGVRQIALFARVGGQPDHPRGIGSSIRHISGSSEWLSKCLVTGGPGSS